jgi:2,4-dienoyl-CoA reductase-like NADH-dependent reductase (Old Yellow Enzyme family)
VSYPRIASLKTADRFTHDLRYNLDLGFESSLPAGGESALGQRIDARPGSSMWAGNRWCILPMEGWDGTIDGHPTDLTRRRWTHFGISGAKIIWGGEAVAVRHDGRANPHQLVINEQTLGDLAALRDTSPHRERYSATDDLLIGVQLTHSGRYSKPTLAGPAPRVAYRHPVLDARVGISDDRPVFTDEELDRLVDDFVAAAVRAHRAGFAFVDIKHCHGYLGHELLSARSRPGKYGGSFDNRLRFLSSIADGIRANAPGLEIGMRLSSARGAFNRPGRIGVPGER